MSRFEAAICCQSERRTRCLPVVTLMPMVPGRCPFGVNQARCRIGGRRRAAGGDAACVHGRGGGGCGNKWAARRALNLGGEGVLSALSKVKDLEDTSRMSRNEPGVWGGDAGGLVSIVTRAILTDLACDLPLRAVERRERRAPRRSGVDGQRPCGHQRWIGDVRYASDSRRIAALPRTVAKGQQHGRGRSFRHSVRRLDAEQFDLGDALAEYGPSAPRSSPASRYAIPYREPPSSSLASGFEHRRFKRLTRARAGPSYKLERRVVSRALVEGSRQEHLALSIRRLGAT
jgi:hypothetical protein